MGPILEDLRSLSLNRVFLDGRGRLRAGWKIMLYAALTILCMAIAASIYDAISWIFAPDQSADSQSNMALYILLLMGVILPAVFMLRVIDGISGLALGFSFHDRVWVEARQGVLQGGCLVTLIFLIEWSAGLIDVRWSGLQVVSICRLSGYYAAFFAAAGAFEETLLRGYPFQVLVQGLGKVGAVCLSSCAFGLSHLLNPNASPLAIFNTMLAGAWLSSSYLKTRSLWLPTALHMSWNLTQGFIYGFPISGVPLSESLMTLSQSGEEWITGGGYGPEGGILSSFVLILATIYLLRSKEVRPSPKAAALWA